MQEKLLKENCLRINVRDEQTVSVNKLLKSQFVLIIGVISCLV